MPDPPAGFVNTNCDSPAGLESLGKSDAKHALPVGDIATSGLFHRDLNTSRGSGLTLFANQ